MGTRSPGWFRIVISGQKDALEEGNNVATDSFESLQIVQV